MSAGRGEAVDCSGVDSGLGELLGQAAHVDGAFAQSEQGFLRSPVRANLGHMTAAGDVLNQVVPTLVRVARRPGAVLLRVAAWAISVFAFLGLVHGVTGTGWASWVSLVLAGFLAVPVLVLAVRRERLQSQTAGLQPHPTIGANPGALVFYDAEPPRDPQWGEGDSLSAAMAENAVRMARFLPRVEAAQRAGLLAAGGPVNAPYLRDDLRVTVAALLGTLAAIPLATLGSIVTAVLVLAS